MRRGFKHKSEKESGKSKDQRYAIVTLQRNYVMCPRWLISTYQFFYDGCISKIYEFSINLSPRVNHHLMFAPLSNTSTRPTFPCHPSPTPRAIESVIQ